MSFRLSGLRRGQAATGLQEFPMCGLDRDYTNPEIEFRLAL